MTDFSFQNRAYDLIQQLIEERNAKPKLNIESINDLKLVIDMTKDVYPLFAEDNESIISLMKDTFSIDIDKNALVETDHKLDELYCPISITEIKPGVVCRIEGACYSNPGMVEQVKIPYYYEHTFPVKEMTNAEYAKEFDFIWDKAQELKVYVKHTYKYKPGDIVYHTIDPLSRGIIVDRKVIDDTSMIYDTPWLQDLRNEYAVFWANVSNNTKITWQYWEREGDLILKTFRWKIRNQRNIRNV